jgi:pimeloyl-ACP methyl ester carboxylesterase
MTDGSKPAILLVHGAIADGSSWSKVLPILQDAGYQAVAVQQPLSSIADDVAKLRGVLDELGTRVVVVGHSSGWRRHHTSRP